MRIQGNTRNQGNSDQMFKPDTTIEEFIPLSSHVAPMVVKTTGGDYLMVWRLGGLPFVGRDEWEIEHRSEEQTSELQSQLRTSYAAFGLKKKNSILGPQHKEHTQR